MTEKFNYKPIDNEGMDILSVIEKADKFNFWMYETIKPYCKGKILEIGSGIGNISQFFIKEKYNITLSDIRDNYCEILRDKFKTHQNGIEVINVDLVDQDKYLRETFTRDYPNVSQSPNRIIIVGSGPAGLFAALRLIELGVKPVVLERGKDVQARRRDIAAINKANIVNPESQFNEIERE